MDVRSKRKMSREITRKNRDSSADSLCASCQGRGWNYSRVYTPCQDCQGRGYQEIQARTLPAH